MTTQHKFSLKRQVCSKTITEEKWRQCAENSHSWKDLRESLGYKKPKHRRCSKYHRRVIKKRCKDLNISLEHIESSVSDEDIKQYVQEATSWHQLGVMIANDRLNEENIFFQSARRDVRGRCDRLEIEYYHLDDIKVGEHDTLYDDCLKVDEHDTLCDYRYLNDLN